MSYRGPRIRATKSPYQYPYMQYPYQNTGTQLTWRDSAPMRTRGADAASLGLGGTLENPTLPLPGAPEVIPVDSGYGSSDCGGNCGKPCCGVGDAGVPAGPIGTVLEKYGQVPGKIVLQAITGSTQGFALNMAATAGMAYLVFRALKKRRR